MPSRPGLRVLAGLAVAGLSILCGPAAVASAAELLTEDGVWTEAAPEDVELDARRTNGRLAVGEKSVPVDRIIGLRFQATAVTETVENGVLLRNGDLLVGAVESLQAGKIEFLSNSFGPISLDIRSVLAFSFGPRGVLDLMRSAAGPGGAELANGDFVRGEVVFVNRETVGVAGGRRVVRVPRERTSLVRLGSRAETGQGTRPGRPRAKPEGSAAVQLVRLASGDRLSGRLARIGPARRRAGETSSSGGAGAGAGPFVVELETAFAGTVELPLAMIVELWSEGGPIVPVSTLEPVDVIQTPQFDERFPHRLDQSLTGSFLSVGGRRFERGIGCHSRCELEYELPRRCSCFLAEIGIDDSAGPRGEAVFRVLVDGEEAFESVPVRGGEGPRTVRVPLRGRSRMRLVADFGPDGSSVADHADWGRAVLVRH